MKLSTLGITVRSPDRVAGGRTGTRCNTSRTDLKFVQVSSAVAAFRLKAHKAEIVANEATEIVPGVHVSDDSVRSGRQVEFDVFDNHGTAVEFDVPRTVAGEDRRCNGRGGQGHANTSFRIIFIPLFKRTFRARPSSGPICNFSKPSRQVGFDFKLLQFSIGLGGKHRKI